MSKDRFYFSPDAGRLVERGGKYYTEYGLVMPSSAHIRMMPIDNVEENYADWSDAKRREVRRAVEAEIKAEEAERSRRIAERDSLAEVAKSKLTEAEYDAVYLRARCRACRRDARARRRSTAAACRTCASRWRRRGRPFRTEGSEPRWPLPHKSRPNRIRLVPARRRTRLRNRMPA